MKAVDLPGRSARGVLVVFMAFFCARRPLCGLRAVGGGRGIGGSGKPGESAFPPRAPRFAPRFSPGGAHRPENRSVRRAGTARFAAVPLSGTRGCRGRRGCRGGVPRAFRLPADGPNGPRAAGTPISIPMAARPPGRS